MNFRHIALICLFIFGKCHQAHAGEFNFSGIGKGLAGAVMFGAVAVYAGGKVAKDIIGSLIYGSKREQEAAREAKEKKDREDREDRERQLEWNRQLANQIAAERFAAQRQAEYEAQAELKQTREIYKSQVSSILQDSENDLASQFELYQEIEIQEVLHQDLSMYQDLSRVGTAPHYLVKRIEALRDYVSGNDVWKEETYQISHSGQLLLQEQGIKVAGYQTYYGNQIQRTLHQEFVDIVNGAGDICGSNDSTIHDHKNIASTITQFADLGQQYNHAGYLKHAFSFADFCQGLKDCAYWSLKLDCDIAVALGKGVWKGTGNFINKVAHPVEAVKNAAKGLGNLFLLVARFNQKMEDTMLELQQYNLNRRREDARNLASGKVTKEELQARDEANWHATKKQLVKDVKVSLDAAWQQVTRENMLYTVERVAEFGTESFLTGQTFKAVAGFVGKASTGLDEFIEAGHGASTLGQLPYNGSSIQAVITHEAIVVQAAAEAARAAQVAGIAIAHVLDEASKLAPGLALMQNGPGNGPSSVTGPSVNVDFIPPVIQYTPMLDDLPEIYKLFHPRKGFGPIADRFIKMDVEHILEGEVITKVKGAKITKKLYGCHHDLLGYLEENNIIQLSDKVMGKFGTYKARPFGHKFYKSFFPQHWLRREVIANIYEAYDNFLKKGIIPALSRDGKWEIIGTSKIGLQITMFIDQNGVIHTAYPLI